MKLTVFAIMIELYVLSKSELATQIKNYTMRHFALDNYNAPCYIGFKRYGYEQSNQKIR